MIKITVKQLQKLSACSEGIDWFKKHKINSLRPLITALLKDNKWNYARWLLPRLMTHTQQINWAIFCAEQVIDIFEKKYPKDQRPRKAIQAAKDFLAGRITKEQVINAAYAAANAAANAANAAANAANAANAAYVAYAAYAANAAANAANAAANAANAADRLKLINVMAEHALQLLGQ